CSGLRGLRSSFVHPCGAKICVGDALCCIMCMEPLWQNCSLILGPSEKSIKSGCETSNKPEMCIPDFRDSDLHDGLKTCMILWKHLSNFILVFIFRNSKTSSASVSRLSLTCLFPL